MSAQVLTHKQASCLFRFTLLKFWEPENTPPPTIGEASDMIGLCMKWLKEKDNRAALKAQLVALVRRWFPDWTGDTLAPRFGARKKSAGTGNGGEDGKQNPAAEHEPEHKAEQPELPAAAELPPRAEAPQAEQAPETEQAPEVKEEETKAEEKAEESEETPPPPPDDETAARVIAMIKAGLTNIWLHGPAGTGKTTLCKQVAAALELPCTILSCNAGTSPAEIVGYQYPQPRPSPVSRAIGQPGIIVLDEITMLDPSVAAVANALLANGELETSTGHVLRHAENIIIATANTVGSGADRQYCGNMQLDAATLDRFACGFVRVDYSAKFEAQFAANVRRYVQQLREQVKASGIRQVVSTRSVINAAKLAAAGMDWKAQLVEQWPDADRRAAGV